jgi:hypothetical protein
MFTSFYAGKIAQTHIVLRAAGIAYWWRSGATPLCSLYKIFSQRGYHYRHEFLPTDAASPVADLFSGSPVQEAEPGQSTWSVPCYT